MLTRFAFALLSASCLVAQQPVPQTPPAAPVQAPASSAQQNQGFRIAGTVVNSLTGQGVPGASVAIAPTSQGSDREISKSVRTGTDGHFAFTGLARGKYSLMATARGFTLQYFNHHDPYATAIAVGPDLDTEHLVFRLQPDAAIEGQVTDENNEPIQNALVRLFQTTTEEGQQKTVPINQSQTDDQGEYRIGHLAPGSYYLSVSARPWYAQNFSPGKKTNTDADARVTQDAATLDVTYPLTFYAGATDSATATLLQLNAGERQTADITLHAVPSLHLRIHTGSNDSSVLGRMVFPRISQRIFQGYLDSVFNAPDSWVAPGVIEISGLSPGHYVVEMPASSGASDKGGGRAWYREVDLSGDADVNASDGAGFTTVGGTILFPDAARVPARASMQLSNPDTGETYRSDINEKGRFDFTAEEVRPGRYVVALEDSQGFFLHGLSATGAKVIGRTIEIAGATNVQIKGTASHGAALVQGTALRNDQPYAGAMIVLVPQDPGNNAPLFRRDQSDSDGTFNLPSVVPGQYTVIAIANGWDLEWANPAVLQPYLKQGERIEVPVDGKLQVKVQVQ